MNGKRLVAPLCLFIVHLLGESPYTKAKMYLRRSSSCRFSQLISTREERSVAAINPRPVSARLPMPIFSLINANDDTTEQLIHLTVIDNFMYHKVKKWLKTFLQRSCGFYRKDSWTRMKKSDENELEAFKKYSSCSYESGYQSYENSFCVLYEIVDDLVNK